MNEMRHMESIKVLYLPVWFTDIVGLAKLDSYNTLDDLLRDIKKAGLKSDDYLRTQMANYAFVNLVYGYNQLDARLNKDSRTIEFVALEGIDLDNVYGKKLLESIYGPHDETVMSVEERDERFRILCRSFEDIKFKTFSNGDVIVYTCRQASQYHTRPSLIKHLTCQVMRFLGYDAAVKTELFKSFLSSQYNDGDIKYALYHRVG